MAESIPQEVFREVSTQRTKPVRSIPVRVDILDATGFVEGTVAVPVFVTVRLVEWYKRHGNEEAEKKLKRAVNLGILAMRLNGGERKSNFFEDQVPAEYLTAERYYVEQKPGIIIDFIPFQNAGLLQGEW